MAPITFAKTKGVFISEEFVVDANFNLHLERKGTGACHIKIKTADGSFSPAATLSGGDVIDIDVYAFVFPKTIVVVSASEVTTGICTMGSPVISDREDPEIVHDKHFIFADGKHYVTADGMYYKVK